MEITRAVISFHVLALMALASCSSAYDFYVGGRDGWGLNPSEKFNNWAERNRFQVNDKLVFRYKKGEDSVLLVTREGYNTCNTTNPIQKLEDGNSVFQLDHSGHFFFISGVHDKCEKGEKLVVLVMAIRHKKTPAAFPPSSSSSSSSSASPLPSVLAPSPSSVSQGPNFEGGFVQGPAPAPSSVSGEEGGAPAGAVSSAPTNGYRVYLGAVGVVLGSVYLV